MQPSNYLNRRKEINIINNKYKECDDYIVIYIVRKDKTVFECKIDKEDFDKISNESWAINWNKGSNCYYAKATHRNVFWNKNVDQWQVSLHKNHKLIFIGYFNDVNIAGKAAEDARQKYYGEFAGGS